MGVNHSFLFTLSRKGHYGDSVLSGRPLTVFMTATLLLACSGDNDTRAEARTGSANGGACPEIKVSTIPGSTCEITLESYDVGAFQHLPEGTPISYCTNPPSGGDHYPVWADFKTYNASVPWPYVVHSLEHGAIVLAYNCSTSECPELVQQLTSVRDAAAVDPLCMPGVKRILLMPSTTIPTRIAAAAWGHVYRASCFDAPSLSAFIRDHYAKTVENFCAAGQSF